MAIVTTPPIAPASVTLTGCDAYRAELSKYGWDVDVALAIMHAESGCVADKNNAGLNTDGSTDYGLMQINSIHADMVDGNLPALYTPETNIAIAYSLYSSHGWTAWSSYNNGQYLRYL